MFLLAQGNAAGAPASGSAAEPAVRVAILQEEESARITIQAVCRLTDLESGRPLAAYDDLKWQEARAAGSGVRLGPREFASTAVVLEPVNPHVLIRVNSRPYRGQVILRRTAERKLTIINRLPLEQYLVGALTSETSSRWPLEVLKAHAVVSRTMVAHRIWIRRNEPYDVTADVSTHVYHGASAERATTRQAVDQTRGQVLAYHGQIFSSTFHANCGGHTEDAAELWSVKGDLFPMKGAPDPYCRGLKHYEWHTEISKGDWDKALGSTAEEVGELEEAEVVERNRSGRVRTLRLRGTRGTATVTGRRLREALGANRLRSLNFQINVTPSKVNLKGLGWGHGVGLCQWGAYGMAREGHTMDEILAAYFPGAQRRALRGLPGFAQANLSNVSSIVNSS